MVQPPHEISVVRYEPVDLYGQRDAKLVFRRANQLPHVRAAVWRQTKLDHRRIGFADSAVQEPGLLRVHFHKPMYLAL